MKPYILKRYRQPIKYNMGKDDQDEPVVKKVVRTANKAKRKLQLVAYKTGIADKQSVKRMISDLKEFGILPSGEDGLNLGIVAPAISGSIRNGWIPRNPLLMRVITDNMITAAKPYLSGASKTSNTLTKEFRNRFGDLFYGDEISDQQINAIIAGRRTAAKKATGKTAQYDSSTKRLNIVENGKVKTRSSIENEDGHLITDYVEGRPGTHGNIQDQLSALLDLASQRGVAAYTGEDWIAGPVHMANAERLGFKLIGNYGRHENASLVPENAKRVIVHNSKSAKKANDLGYHYVYPEAPVYQVTKNASNIYTKDINLVDPRIITADGKIPYFSLNRGLYRAAVPIGAAYWASLYDDGKNSELVLQLYLNPGFVSTWDIKNPNPIKERPAPLINNSTNGGYDEKLLKKNVKTHKRWDPTTNIDPVSAILNLALGGNEARGEEDQYWRAYLGLNNAVPTMDPKDATYWDKRIEDEKELSGEHRSDFYGITPRMKYAASMVADTLNLGKLVRSGHEEYKNLYNTAKKILNNPYKYQLVKARDVESSLEMPIVNGEYNPLGMLANFGMMWNPEEQRLYLHDTYDFNKMARMFSGIPKRPIEMKIRGSVPFSPYIGSEMFNLGYKYIPDLTVNYNGGKSPIHIKPLNRGKFTALKKRTGHSTAWFKAHGTPALKKMAVFALNARKWKH